MKRAIALEIKILDNMIMRKVFTNIKNGDKQLITPTPVQLRILRYLYDNIDKEVYQKDIEREISVRRSTASGIINTMEKNGMIARMSSDLDGRVKRIIMTDKYIDSVTELEEKIISFEKELVKNINEQDLKVFLKVIDEMKKNLVK